MCQPRALLTQSRNRKSFFLCSHVLVSSCPKSRVNASGVHFSGHQRVREKAMIFRSFPQTYQKNLEPLPRLRTVSPVARNGEQGLREIWISALDLAPLSLEPPLFICRMRVSSDLFCSALWKAVSQRRIDADSYGTPLVLRSRTRLEHHNIR